MTLGWERGVEHLDGRKHPGTLAKMNPCGCVVPFASLGDYPPADKDPTETVRSS